MRSVADSLVLATFNVHLGMDGWGRPFDVVGQCAELGADVLVMQESWRPESGGPSTAERVASELGYPVVVEAALGHAQRFEPVPDSRRSWGPAPWSTNRAFSLDQDRRPLRRTGRTVMPGWWEVAVLSRVPIRSQTTLWLDRLRRDPAERAVIRVTTDFGGRELTLMGTHMSHLTDFSPLQYRRLAALLPPRDTPAALAGDMNLWGPPVTSFFPAWRRAVTGRTWPAHRPHSQLDHVLITESLSVLEAHVADRSGSDHRPVVVRLALA